MTKPFDVSKFRKSLTKTIPGVSEGFYDPTDWLSTGNYILNYLVSGDFYKGVPSGKVSVFAGESGSGKSYFVSGNLVKNAQEKGYFCVLVDSENALDEQWLNALGVSTDEDKLLRINASMIDDVARIIGEFMKGYRDEASKYEKREDMPKVLFVVDSLGMLMAPSETAQFEKGDMKGDLGRKAKQLTSLVRNTVNMIAPYPIALVATNHTYASQDMFDPDDKVSGGQGFVYASSVLIAMKKKKLKEDEHGVKTSKVHGIKASCKIMKTRYNKPFEQADVYIPYETGMDPYSGLFDFFETKGILVKQGNRYKFDSLMGEEHSFIEFRKNISNDQYDQIMAEFPHWQAKQDELFACTANEDGEIDETEQTQAE